MSNERSRTLANTLYRSALALFALGAVACTETEGNPDGGTQACGSRGTPPCDTGDFCKFPPSAQCGVFDAPGVCTDRPSICTKEYAPVCGCDGETYSNECTANAAGVSAKASGECAVPEPDAGTPEEDGGGGPGFCGGFAGFKCPTGEFCNYPVETNCGSGDQAGACTVPPDFCPTIYKPVCGCDGKTYSNACAASAASVSVRADGPCS